RHGEKYDAAKHLVGRANKAEHIFLSAGAYQVWFVVRQNKGLVASQMVNVNVVRPRKTSGQVTNVISKFGVVHIDIGKKDIEVGAMFTVRRGNQLVGQLVAGRVEPRMSFCRLVKANSPGQPQVGDQIVLVK
ncbi:MAG: hypothetical protein VYD34_06905, partial [Verrucomicrobiota bacterium]|nr:hypothetical protein [Verrucomicrobiota bacterium]